MSAQPNKMATLRSLPTPVGEVQTLGEIAPGTYGIMSMPKESGLSGVSLSDRASTQRAIRIDYLSTEFLWRGRSPILTAIRVHRSREPSRWIVVASDAVLKLRQELLSYAHLENNWDGDGAKAPSIEAIDDALTFLDGRPADIPLPRPEEGSDGDVGVYWDNGNAQIFAEVSFEGDGSFAYFAVQGAPGAVIQECGDDGLNVASPWPEDLLRILRAQDPA